MKQYLKTFVPYAIVGAGGAGLGIVAGDIVSGPFEPLGSMAGIVTTGLLTGLFGVVAVATKIVK